MSGLNNQVPRMTTEEIEAKISEREKARAQRDWATADAIRDELRSNGVQVLDKEAIWRGEDDSIGVYAGPKGIPDKGIRYLLDYRETVRARKDWDHADAVRQLLRDHGVQVFDKDGTWRADDGRNGLIKAGDFNPQSNGRRDEGRNSNGVNNYGPARGRDNQPMRSSPYHRDDSGFEQPRFDKNYDFVSGFDVPQGTVLVVDLLGKREQARQARDFETADDIRRVLGMCGVMIHDKTRTYSLQDGTICEMPALQPAQNVNMAICQNMSPGSMEQQQPQVMDLATMQTNNLQLPMLPMIAVTPSAMSNGMVSLCPTPAFPVSPSNVSNVSGFPGNNHGFDMTQAAPQGMVNMCPSPNATPQGQNSLSPPGGQGNVTMQMAPSPSMQPVSMPMPSIQPMRYSISNISDASDGSTLNVPVYTMGAPMQQSNQMGMMQNQQQSSFMVC